LEESKYFVLIMTSGFDLSREVANEIVWRESKPIKLLFILGIEAWAET